ncbi:MAG: hypothetical protein ACU0C9_08800, partial [Paracoccaceae bacterium]
LCDKQGRPVRLYLTEGQRSDFKGAGVLLKNLPKAETLIGDKGYRRSIFYGWAEAVVLCVSNGSRSFTQTGHSREKS